MSKKIGTCSRKCAASKVGGKRKRKSCMSRCMSKKGRHCKRGRTKAGKCRKRARR